MGRRSATTCTFSMTLPQDFQPSVDAASPLRSIRYEDWKGRIQMATELDQLVGAVRDYLAAWRADQLLALPVELGVTVLRSSEEIASRAVIATQAELKADADEPGTALLREMAYTMMAAASRLRFLTAMRTREGRPRR